MATLRPGDKIKIRESHGTPGFGGLNFIALREDGWRPGVELEVSEVWGDGSVTARWGGDFRQCRTLWPREFSVKEPTQERQPALNP